MWKRLQPLLTGLWRRLRRGHDERRVAEARKRFWAEVRAGEREAEAQLRP
jgi:chromosome condensin MukBEF MukE localization factor